MFFSNHNWTGKILFITEFLCFIIKVTCANEIKVDVRIAFPDMTDVRIIYSIGRSQLIKVVKQKFYCHWYMGLTKNCLHKMIHEVQQWNLETKKKTGCVKQLLARHLVP